MPTWPKVIVSWNRPKLGRPSPPSRRIAIQKSATARMACVAAQMANPSATVSPNEAQTTTASNGYSHVVTAVTRACVRNRLQPSMNR